MIKNLFTKHDHRSVAGITKEQAVQAASWYWRSRQFGVTFTSPFSMTGSQYHSKLGLRQSVIVWVADEGSNVGVDVTFAAELTDEGAIVGAIGAVLVLPAAVALGAVSYIEYENDAQRQMNEFWTYVYSFPKNPVPPSGPASPAGWVQGQVAQPVPPAPSQIKENTCPNCGIFIDKDSRFCRNCGTKL